MYYTSEVYYNRSLPNLLHKTKTSVTIYGQFVTDVVAKKIPIWNKNILHTSLSMVPLSNLELVIPDQVQKN